MNCQNCNKDLAQNAQFCPNCGTRVQQQIDDIKDSGIVTIGRAMDNTLCANSDGVSSHHARIYIESGTLMIEDLNSTNGTFINGQRIIKSELSINSCVYLGSGYSFYPSNNLAIKNLVDRSFVIKTPVKTSLESVSYNPNVYQVQPVGNQFSTPNNSPQMQSQQVNVNIYHKSKSVGTALVLTFFFGPLGMLYSTVPGAIIMFFVSVFLSLVTFGFSVFFTWPVCMVWAAIAADNENKQAMVSTQSINRSY